MCLMMGPGAFQAPFKANTATKKWRGILLIVGVVHLVLAVMVMYVGITDKGMTELFDIIILFCALCRLDYCCLIIYALNCAINFFRDFSIIGLAL